jgi:chorismate mutase/prephenate dehydratase
MSGADKKLESIRKEIDQLDGELMALINRRAGLAQKVAEVKDDEGATHYYRPEREARVLRTLLAANQGPLPGEHVSRIFQEIMSACRALQKPLGVAYLGPEGTFTEAAAFKHFGHAIEAEPLDSIESVFREVESKAGSYGVVPIENSTEGVVSHTLDMFVDSTLCICGEVELRIHHCLMSKVGDINRIATVYSHQQSLAQCRRWLDTNLPRATREGVSSNADAARRAAGEPGAAAVAGRVAAENSGLSVLAENIEDKPDNTTRFLVIGHQSVAATGADKTSVLFSAKDRPGALYDLLESFKKRDINMTRIESRPSSSGTWRYVFYVDFEGHAEEANIAEAIDDLRRHASFMKVLGSYPRTGAWAGE